MLQLACGIDGPFTLAKGHGASSLEDPLRMDPWRVREYNVLPECPGGQRVALVVFEGSRGLLLPGGSGKGTGSKDEEVQEHPAHPHARARDGEPAAADPAAAAAAVVRERCS